MKLSDFLIISSVEKYRDKQTEDRLLSERQEKYKVWYLHKFNPRVKTLSLNTRFFCKNGTNL